MPEIENLGKVLVVIGVVVILIGLAVVVAARLPGIGRLPGDILIRRGGLTFYFPILSCIILSIILTVIASVIGRLMR